MQFGVHPPQWLEILAWLSIILALGSALFIIFDIYVRDNRQHMRIMEAVYPITALYFGPLTIWFYLKYGRQNTHKMMGHTNHEHGMHEKENPKWHQISKGVSHCGAGCTVGDIIAAWLIFAFGITIAGKELYADFVLDFIFAWLLGIFFQYYTIVSMRQTNRLRAIWQAIKIDTLSIIAFEVGLFFGMYLYQEWLFSHPLPKNSASFWFFMQLAMILGFFTAYPVNLWLIKRGIKEAM
jgi:hypothetical protein